MGSGYVGVGPQSFMKCCYNIGRVSERIDFSRELFNLSFILDFDK